MSGLGIYFGPKTISIIQANKKKLMLDLQIPFSKIGSESEEKIPEEVKLTALLKDELRKSKIDSDQVAVVLSGKDVIVRTFEMPAIPFEELKAAVNFEAKKYLPFKIEELILDYQVVFNKSTKKNLVLLTAIKKEVLDKYFSIFSQLNLKITSLEYSAFSILRFLQSNGIKEKGVASFVNLDLDEEDEMNFVVVENGFPLFCRDIILTDENREEYVESKTTQYSTVLDKIKAELRISLDFYKRKFLQKNIEKLYLIAPKEYQPDLQVFLNERALKGIFLDAQKYLDKPIVFSLGLYKAYGGVLINAFTKSSITIDLLSAKTRSISLKEGPAASQKQQLGLLLEGIHFDSRIILLCILLVGGAYGYGYLQKLPLNKEMAALKSSCPQIKSTNADVNNDELERYNSNLKNKVNSLFDIIENQPFLTSQVNAIVKNMPTGMWLTSFNFIKKDEKNGQLSISGKTYLGDTEKEASAIQLFVNHLKEDPAFSKAYKKISIVYIDSEQLETTIVTKFELSCGN